MKQLHLLSNKLSKTHRKSPHTSYSSRSTDTTVTTCTNRCCMETPTPDSRRQQLNIITGCFMSNLWSLHNKAWGVFLDGFQWALSTNGLASISQREQEGLCKGEEEEKGEEEGVCPLICPVSSKGWNDLFYSKSKKKVIRFLIPSFTVFRIFWYLFPGAVPYL